MKDVKPEDLTAFLTDVTKVVDAIETMLDKYGVMGVGDVSIEETKTKASPEQLELLNALEAKMARVDEKMLKLP